MGGAASIEVAKNMELDYAAIKSSGIDFTAAYSALENKLHKGHSEVIRGDMSINFLAIRQLSQNLRNQDSLERTRQKVLKSHSMPGNHKFKSKSYDSMDEYDEPYDDGADDLDNADLSLVRDELLAEEEEDVKAIEEPAPRKKKPALFLHVNSSKSIMDDEHLGNNGGGGPAGPLPKALSPSAHARVSPRGTLYMGKWKVMENGIFPDNSETNSSSEPMSTFEARKKSYRQDHGYVGEVTAAGSYLWRVRRNDSGEIVTSVPSTDEDGMLLPALGGKKDFVEISTLGSGASGVVTEALHVPSLTIVALKILPIYNEEKRRHVSRELAVLFRNLTEMRLVDDRLDWQDSTKVNQNNNNNPFEASSSNRRRCPNVLSLFNAFIDPRSGMINLVVEYMDGGSLEDLVKQGGCSDEQVLADIAYQTLNGLCYLHKNKHVHRDIKPANILCSTSGTIKIADFGISKALDKSSGFANTFVGTVCYMSPERITGEVYSFPCDLWSLGLTLLAVARGRFPISLKDAMDNDDSDPGVIGGPGGYWAMIKAICDNDPPEAGPDFSPSFNSFIDSCLRKDPTQRLTAHQLMQSPFVLSAVSPGKYDWSPEDLDDENSQSQHTSASSSHRGQQQQTPLTARLTSVTIARTAPKESLPCNPSLVAEEKEEQGEDEDDETGLPKRSRPNYADVAQEYEGDEEMAVIYAIRMEHLERLLEKLSTKLRIFQEATTDHSLAVTEEDNKKRSPLIAGGRSRKSQEPLATTSSFENLVLPPLESRGKARLVINRDDHHADIGTNSGGGEDKIVPIAATHTRASLGFASSTRSVHFQDPDPPSKRETREPPKPNNFRARANLKQLELNVINDDGDESASSSLGQPMAQKLPKTSSYFLSSQSKDESADSAEERKAVAKATRVDYSKMIPRFDLKGLSKWRNLANQLHLPLPLVMLAVKSTLGQWIELGQSVEHVEENS